MHFVCRPAITWLIFLRRLHYHSYYQMVLMSYIVPVNLLKGVYGRVEVSGFPSQEVYFLMALELSVSKQFVT